MSYTPKDPVVAPIRVEFTPGPSFSAKPRKQVGFLWKNTSIFHSEDLLRLLLIVGAITDEDSHYENPKEEKHFVFSTDTSANWVNIERPWRRSEHMYDVSPVMKELLTEQRSSSYYCKIVIATNHPAKETSAELFSRTIDNSDGKSYFLLRDEEVIELAVSVVNSMYNRASAELQAIFRETFFGGVDINSFHSRKYTVQSARETCAKRVEEFIRMACDDKIPKIRFSNKQLFFSTSPDRERLGEMQRAFKTKAYDVRAVRKKLLSIKKVSEKQLKIEFAKEANEAARQHLIKAAEELMKAEQAMQHAIDEAAKNYDRISEVK
jgi:hypothetical protein